MAMKSEYFDCKCDSEEHTLRFGYDEEDTELYTAIFLNQYRSWYTRIWVSIKYVLGYKCKYGHWDCTMLKDSDISRLRDLCNKVLDNETT